MRAETLLSRAATSGGQITRPSHLRIRTRTVSFVRPAAIRGELSEDKEEAAIREHFAAAHYDWQEPLSVQSYSNWRHSLTQKTSKVSPVRDERTGQPEQRIETTTIGGELQSASLSLDASLAPVSGLFRFADQEWVEIAGRLRSRAGAASGCYSRGCGSNPASRRSRVLAAIIR